MYKYNSIYKFKRRYAMKKKFLLSLVASGILLSGMSFGLVTKHIDNAYAVDSKEEAKYL